MGPLHQGSSRGIWDGPQEWPSVCAEEGGPLHRSVIYTSVAFSFSLRRITFSVAWVGLAFARLRAGDVHR